MPCRRKIRRFRIGAALVAAFLVAGLAAFLRVRLPDEAPLPQKARPGALRLVPVPSLGSKGAERSAVSADVSAAVRTVCGLEAESARSYPARSRALRSVSSCRDLSADDVESLLDYVVAVDDALPPGRTAALKNDVLNLLRNQVPVPADLVSTLVEMIRSGEYSPTITDYCIQHLGAMWRSFPTDSERQYARWAFEKAAGRHGVPYAGTALYSLADEPRKSADDERRLRYLTVTLATDESSNPLARMSAIQLAAERGYSEILHSVRRILAGDHPEVAMALVAVGALGRLGSGADEALIESMREKGGLRLHPAVDAALAGISERESNRRRTTDK